MRYTDMLADAAQATPETLPDVMKELFVALHEAALTDTEVEMVLQALHKAAKASIQREAWMMWL